MTPEFCLTACACSALAGYYYGRTFNLRRFDDLKRKADDAQAQNRADADALVLFDQQLQAREFRCRKRERALDSWVQMTAGGTRG